MIARPVFILILIVAPVLASLPALGQTTVTIRPVARIDAGQPLTLGDVAQISAQSGLGALVFDDTDIIRPSSGGRSGSVGAEDVIRLLDSAGIAAADVRIRGHRCEILVRPARARAAAHGNEPIDAASSGAGSAAGVTVRDHVRHRLRALLGVEDEHLEITPEPRDEAVLETPTLGWTVEVRVTGFSRRTPLRITMYADDGTIREEAVRIGIRTSRDIVRARHHLARGAQLSLDDLVTDRVWLAPDVQPVALEDAAGLVLKSRIKAGEMLTRSAVESPVVVQRGEVIVVHVVSETIVLRREARALADGRVGDMIEFEPLTADGGLLTARVESPGRALVLLQHRATGAHEPAPAQAVRVSRRGDPR